MKKYSEDQLMHIFFDNFHEGGQYSAQIASYQKESRREEYITDQKYLSISYLHTNYLNIYSSSGSGNNSERANIAQTKYTFCGCDNHSVEKCVKSIRKYLKKSCAAGDSE